MFRIRRFGVLRTATVVAVFYAVTFAILVVPVLLLALATGPRMPGFAGGVLIGGVIAALVVYPLIGWVFTAIACLIYNLVARWVGGIEVQVERVYPPGPPPDYGYGGSYPPGWNAGLNQGTTGQVSGDAPWGTEPRIPPPGSVPPERR